MERTCRAADLVATLSLAVMMAVVVLDVVLRYAFNMPVAASIELVEAGIVGTVFMALPGASAHGSHISIDYLDALLSQRLRVLLDRVSHLLIALLLAGLAVLLAQRGMLFLQRGDVSITLNYPTGYLALFMSVAIALAGLVHLHRFMRPDVPREAMR